MAVRIIAGGIIACWIALGIACEVSIWRECRAAGHSRLVCARWVSR